MYVTKFKLQKTYVSTSDVTNSDFLNTDRTRTFSKTCGLDSNIQFFIRTRTKIFKYCIAPEHRTYSKT